MFPKIPAALSSHPWNNLDIKKRPERGSFRQGGSERRGSFNSFRQEHIDDKKISTRRRIF
jgi:hypothetical protein